MTECISFYFLFHSLDTFINKKRSFGNERNLKLKAYPIGDHYNRFLLYVPFKVYVDRNIYLDCVLLILVIKKNPIP